MISIIHNVYHFTNFEYNNRQIIFVINFIYTHDLPFIVNTFSVRVQLNIVFTFLILVNIIHEIMKRDVRIRTMNIGVDKTKKRVLNSG